jgi:DNA modification methylase
MNIRKVPLHLIKPYENNVKNHPVSQLESITNSIKKFGFRQPIVIDKNNVIVAGHARYEAAATLGMAEVTCELADDLSEEEINAYRILDNEIAKQGTTNVDALQSELARLPDFDFSPFNVEFPKIEVLPEGKCDEDETPELKIEATTKLGDIWVLGNHRLMCGDSTEMTAVNALLGENKVDIVFTDPPYDIDENTDRVRSKRTQVAKAGVYEKIIGDENTQTAIDAFNLCAGMNIPIMVFWGANHYCHALPESPNWLVWDKREEDKQRDGNSDCELAWVKSKAKSVRIFRHLWKGMIKASEQGKGRVHPTQKPIALSEWCFNEYGKDAKSVLDLFGGSGSTLIACEKTNRKCFMMELAPTYCDVIINRWQKFSGKEAILESSGKKFNELSPLV